MRTAIFISKFYPEFSGVGYRIIKLYDQLNKKNLTVDVFCGGKENNFSYSYRYKFFNVRRLYDAPKHSSRLIKIFSSTYYFLKIFFILKKKKYDFIHVVGSNTVTTAAINASSLLEIPRIIELVTKKSSPYQLLPIIKYFYKPNFIFNSLIISINKQILSNFKNQNIKNKIWIRDNPIGRNFIYPNKYKLDKKKYGFKKKDIIISQIAQFYLSKNQIFLIDVLAHLPYKYKLILAGPLDRKSQNAEKDIEYFRNIKKKIKYYNLEERVKLFPKLINPIEILNISTFSAMPNYNEGFGNPLVESLGLGIPVIANYEEKVFRKWIINSFNGHLIKLNPEEWAKKIEDYNLKYSRKKISRDIHKKLNYDEYINNYSKIFDYFSRINKKININIKRIINLKK